MKSKFVLISAILATFFLIFSQVAFAEDCGDDCYCDCGTGTPGYWKNHPEAWPVDSIYIGGIEYTKEEAIERMNESVAGDKTNTMFKALVAAILNVENGCDPSCVEDCICAADWWMGYVTGPVRANSYAWRDCGEYLYWCLDDYNNGRRCAPSRDALE